MNFFVVKARDIAIKNRDVLLDSGVFQFFYAWTLLVMARRNRNKGRFLSAVDYYCMIGRHVEMYPYIINAAHEEFMDSLSELVHPDGRLIHIENNPFLNNFLKSELCKRIRAKHEGKSEFERVTLSGGLLLLKRYNETTNEKGVLLVKYTSHQQEFFSLYDISLLSKYYIVVAEPSWAGSMLPLYFQYIGNNFDVVIQFPLDKDIAFIKSLNTNLIPIKLWSGYWVDFDVFKPLANIQKEYDLVYVANWAPWKGHKRFFRVLKTLKSYNLKVALVGFPWGNRTKEDMVAQARKYKVDENITIFESISPMVLNEVLNKSKVNILLSRREGGNRSIFEAMLAGIPVIVYKRNLGINLDSINSSTGKLGDEEELPEIILDMVANYEKYAPREWAMKNMGYLNATYKLNELLKKICKNKWATDIVPKENRPNLCYATEKDEEKMKIGYTHLRSMLR